MRERFTFLFLFFFYGFVLTVSPSIAKDRKVDCRALADAGFTVTGLKNGELIKGLNGFGAWEITKLPAYSGSYLVETKTEDWRGQLFTDGWFIRVTDPQSQYDELGARGSELTR